MSWRQVAERSIDERRRISLKGVGKSKHTRYTISEGNDGSILLYPVISMPIKEAEEMTRHDGIFGERARTAGYE